MTFARGIGRCCGTSRTERRSVGEILRGAFQRSRPGRSPGNAHAVRPAPNASGGRRSHLWDLALFFGICWSALLVGACGSAVRVKAAYDPAAPFQQYRTFAMLEPNRPVPTGMDSDPFTLRQLRELTYKALVARGFRAVPLEQADVVVGVLARFQQQVDVTSGPYMGPYDYRYYGYGPRYGGPWGGFGMTYGPTVTKYDEMQVAIDLIDPKKNEVRWRGYGARRADRRLKTAEMQEMIERILSQYPPSPAQAQ